MTDIHQFFSSEDEQTILAAIKQAEQNTSGEIRVRVEPQAGKDPLQSARTAFEKLGMRNTELHNGVLFYLGINDHTFVILGDDNINKNVPENFWNDVRDIVLDNFRNNQFAQGLAAGIIKAGEQLQKYYPCEKNDINELPDAISYADKGDSQ